MKFRSLSLISLLMCMITFNSSAQESWPWQWGKKLPQTPSGYPTDIQTDVFNNIYAVYIYQDSIDFGDTLFRHEQGFTSYSNFAIVKYSTEGKFLNALDIYTEGNADLFHLKLAIDHEQNIYLAGEFSYNVFIQDTVIEHSNTAYPASPDIFLAKLNRNFDFLWYKLNYSPLQDFAGSMILHEDHIYMFNGYKYFEPIGLNYVNFFGQDSMVYEMEMNSIIKLDLDGNMIWHKDMYNKTSPLNSHLLQTAPGNYLYVFDQAPSDLYIHDDTINCPHYPEFTYVPLMLKFTTSGDYIEARFFEQTFGFMEVEVDDQHDFYISGYVHDTLILGQDTIVRPDGILKTFLAKTTPKLESYWHQVFTWDPPAQEMTNPKIELQENSLFYSFSVNRDFVFYDSTYAIGPFAETFLGVFDSAGQLIHNKITVSTYGIKNHLMRLDNCKNMILAGKFDGEVYFNQDTLFSPSHAIEDYFLARNLRLDPLTYHLGKDTLVCDQITLTAPQGHMYYRWNDSLTDSPEFTVHETSLVSMSFAGEEGCWSQPDSIFIRVHPMPETNWPADTSIKLSDTLQLSTVIPYEHYLWSTGDTASSISLPATELGSGSHTIWLQIDDGPCSTIDTLNIQIIDDTGLDENRPKSMIRIYPNPSTALFQLESEIPVDGIKLYNSQGEELNQSLVHKRSDNQFMIILATQTRGMYFLLIKTDHGNIYRKLIKQ